MVALNGCVPAIFSAQTQQTFRCMCPTVWSSIPKNIENFSSKTNFVDFSLVNNNPLLYQLSDQYNKNSNKKKPLLREYERGSKISSRDKSSLRALAAKTYLSQISIKTVMRGITIGNSSLHFEQAFFLRRLSEVLFETLGVETAENDLAELFGTLDSNDNGILDFVEVLLGLSQLCGGTAEEKLSAVFGVFKNEKLQQENSQEDRFYFQQVMVVFTLIYRVILTSNMVVNLKQVGLEFDTVDELALFSTLEVFRKILRLRDLEQNCGNDVSCLCTPSSLKSIETFLLHSDDDDYDSLPSNDMIENLLHGKEVSSCYIDYLNLEGKTTTAEPSFRKDGTTNEPLAICYEGNSIRHLIVDKTARPWKESSAKNNLFITCREFGQLCRHTPDKFDFSKSNTLLAPLIRILRKVVQQ